MNIVAGLDVNETTNGAAPEAPGSGGLALTRLFSRAGVDPLDAVDWQIRDARIDGPMGVVFEQKGVEFPSFWSETATNIVAQKYFRGRVGAPERERSVKQMIRRVVGTIARWGREGGYFAKEEDALIFEAELTHILVHQMASFNSPVWFNVGFELHPQASACFILSVEDTMESVLAWPRNEGRIFAGGSGSGINLSPIRGSQEHLSRGGLASGPVPFMRAADSSAGAIKSGGKTRRAAKLVCLDADHPDIVDFIECKVREEEKASALAAAGFDMSLNSDGYALLQFQNANNSVRVTDAFMHAVEQDLSWTLRARVDGHATNVIPARTLFHKIAEAAWRCADPGLQYDTTINDWHTCPNSSRINASNPCSEYMHVDNSACNLASLNLHRFHGRVYGDNRPRYTHPEHRFDVDAFEHAIDIMILAQEIVVGPASYPTPEIERNSHAFRQLGLGFTNLGSLLLANALPYDSPPARAIAGAVTSVMTGRAYRMSAEIAGALGPYERFRENSGPHYRVIAKHLEASRRLPPMALFTSGYADLRTRALDVWDEAHELGRVHGYRNAQATVLAPTGTISFLMDAATTGIEPDFALAKEKDLVGGGRVVTTNPIVAEALDALGYSRSQKASILQHLHDKRTIVGAPALILEHLPIFDTAAGDRPISVDGHLGMMAAVQPFVSGAISKTINMPASSSVEDVENAYMTAWKLGLKSIAVYRDGCKNVQILSAPSPATATATATTQRHEPTRRKLPPERLARTHKFQIGDHEGYITAGEFEDGSIGEIFLNGVGKEGSTLKGMMNAFATSFSIQLQYGVPLATLVRKFAHMRFEPEGATGNPEIPFARSIVDYIVRWVASRYCSAELRAELGIIARAGGDGTNRLPPPSSPLRGPSAIAPPAPPSSTDVDSGNSCATCGSMMQRTGPCFTCSTCGANTGCG